MKKLMSILTALTVASAGAAFASGDQSAAAPAHKHPTAKEESAGDGMLTGKVTETMNAGGYTYVNIEKDGKKTWIAIPETKITVGKEMTFLPGAAMQNFESKTLKRTFDVIIFSGGVAEGSAPQGPTGSKAQVGAKEKNVKVTKATGANACTVAEAYGKSAALNKKTVVVKGKVVKVSKNIMGKNWVHLQDGTGDQTKGTHNLVVTTQDAPEVGDVVTATGTLTKDRDFGAGYKYNVIVEDASVKK
ncbi:MAG: hypothetical protein M0042_08585 [Nitrospiraceae bacterium]|nr:hypothetical protein [Nitrospiraceae bacterium]